MANHDALEPSATYAVMLTSTHFLARIGLVAEGNRAAATERTPVGRLPLRRILDLDVVVARPEDRDRQGTVHRLQSRILDAGFGAVVDSVSHVLALGAENINPALEMNACFAASFVMEMGGVKRADIERTLILIE